MKKIFTMILLAAGTISFASAQSYNQKNMAHNNDKKISRDESFAFDKNKSVDYKDNYFSYKEKQAKIEKINREFDKKIDAVKFNRRLNGREKTKQIQLLQMQQKNEISKVEYEYAKSNQKSKGHSAHF